MKGKPLAPQKQQTNKDGKKPQDQRFQKQDGQKARPPPTQKTVKPDELLASTLSKSSIDTLAKYINTNPQQQYVPHIVMFHTEEEFENERVVADDVVQKIKMYEMFCVLLPKI
jgi:hypothetical protein